MARSRTQRRRRVALIDLGCAKNTVDSEGALGRLLSHEFAFTADVRTADLLLVNTCAFIQAAKEEGVAHLLEAVGWKRKNPRLRVAAMGCLAERYGAELAGSIPELDGVLGFAAYPRLLAACRRILAGERVLLCGQGKRGLPEGTPRLLLTGGAYAYLRIAEGCDNRCAYCAVPGIRGSFRSRSESAILREARQLVAAGARELPIVAQDPGRYGSDRAGRLSLARLLRKLLRLEGAPWIRLLYLHPAHLAPEVIDLLAGEENLLRYLDLPVQHVSTRILRRMGRGYTRTKINSLLDTLRRKVPGLVLRTSLICGFPGETENDFASLLRWVEEGQVQHLGVFPYSREEGTRAYRMGPAVPADIAEDRCRALMAAQQAVTFRWLDSRVGGEEAVLVEGARPEGGFYGRTRCEAPEVDGEIQLPGAKISVGTRILACLVKRRGYDLIANPAGA